jgi:hypothetical protein
MYYTPFLIVKVAQLLGLQSRLVYYFYYLFININNKEIHSNQALRKKIIKKPLK